MTRCSEFSRTLRKLAMEDMSCCLVLDAMVMLSRGLTLLTTL